jgi:putative oxidoreductase
MAQATAAGVAETAGGALLITGAATPLAAGMLSGTMAVAVRKVHLANGVWATDGGFEYNAVLLAALFAITADGPGTGALDEGHTGPGWALAEFAAGVLASEAILRFADSRPAPAQNAQDAMDTASARTPEPAGAAV